MVEGLGPVIGTSRPATIALLNHNVRSILHQKELKEAHPADRGEVHLAERVRFRRIRRQVAIGPERRGPKDETERKGE